MKAISQNSLRSNDRIRIYTVDANGNRTWHPTIYASIADAMIEVRRLEAEPGIAAAVPTTNF